MKLKFNLITVLLCLFGGTTFGQTTYSTSINASGGQSYTVNIEIVLTDIVPVQSTCTWGYNYDVAYDYDIEIVGSSSNLYTLSGYLTCGSNQGIYFDLPNNGGSGSDVTQGNPWNSNSDCATATIESLECNSIDLVIEGAGIPNQTITLEPTTGGNGDGSEWDTNGNSCDTSAFIGTVNQSDLRFRTNNIERMRLTDDGKFGIGVTNPLENLELQGNFKLSGDAIFSDYADVNDSLGKFLFVDQNGRTFPKTLDQLKTDLYALPIDISASICKLQGVQQNPIWSNGPNKIFSFCPEVFVGIGTNDPKKSLDVRGTTQTRNLEVGRAYSDFSLISGYREGVASAALLSLGQFNPQTQTEHVALELTSSGELSLNYKELQQGSTGKILSINSEGNNVLKINDEGNLYLNYLGQGQALTIRSESDNRKLLELENDGLLRSRKIRIDLESWSDFVFEEDYQLMPLADLKVYIAKNNHLPDIPSEGELVEEGLDLAEMNKLLMQKVEELTLYLLDQSDKTEQLQKEIEALKLKLSRLE